MTAPTPPLRRYRALVRALLDAGVAPTPTEFAKRGLGYTAHGPGSGTTWVAGKYAAARREVLAEYGWVYDERLRRYVPGS